MVLTLFMPLLHAVGLSLTLYLIPDVFISWIDSSPALACTVLDNASWNTPTYFAMAQLMVIKIILVASPSTFLQMNSR
jgi:hypothetical protein